MDKISTEADLQNCIENQTEESLYLDYKGAGALAKTEAKKDEISKDVSAMANSDGGVIIYGIKEFSEPEGKKHLPEKIDPVNRLDFSKEWLEQILHSRISPRISNIIIEPISVGVNVTDVVYVVTIPKSNTAHQANDKRYYKRSNSISIPMHDYEIRDILNRAQHPLIRIEFKIETKTFQVRDEFGIHDPLLTKKEPKYQTNTELFVYAYNEGKILAKYVNCYLEIPARILNLAQYGTPVIVNREGVEYVKDYCENSVRDVIGSTGLGFGSFPNYGPARHIPILPKTNINMTKNVDWRIKLVKELNLNDEKIYWTVYADNAEPLSGEVCLNNIPVRDISKDKQYVEL